MTKSTHSHVVKKYRYLMLNIYTYPFIKVFIFTSKIKIKKVFKKKTNEKIKIARKLF